MRYQDLLSTAFPLNQLRQHTRQSMRQNVAIGGMFAQRSHRGPALFDFVAFTKFGEGFIALREVAGHP